MCDHTDPEVLDRLYNDEEMSLREMAQHLGVHHNTVWYHLKKNEIQRRRVGAQPQHFAPARFRTSERGYEKWFVQDHVDGRQHPVYVHRLLAVAEYGIEAVSSDKDIHHKNEIPWDNRPENIEVMGHAEHRRHHMQSTGGELTDV